jgi:ATP-dependent Clp protease ATP-binding subunit ClpB
VLDDGRLTDGQGRTVDFRNTVVVMTSNLGSHEIQRMSGQPLGDIKDAVMVEVKNHFRPEFINRIDEIVVFHALGQDHVRRIAGIQLQRLAARLAERDMQLEVSEEALDEIAKVGFDPLFGARPLKRAIQSRIENPVAKLILEGKFGPNDVIPVDLKEGQLSFERIVH